MIKKTLLILTLLFFGNISIAQQTIFNVPNADITPKGRLFLEGEAQFRPYAPNRNLLNTNFAAVGIGHNSEIDFATFNISTPASNNIVLGTGFRSVVPILKEQLPKRELKITIGSEILIPVQQSGVGNWTYAHLSTRIPKSKTRITAGLSAGTSHIFGKDTICFIGAIEQPVTKNLNLIADWFSGQENYAGFLIAGASYSLPKDKTILVGYQIPNDSSNGSAGFVIELAKIY